MAPVDSGPATSDHQVMSQQQSDGQSTLQSPPDRSEKNELVSAMTVVVDSKNSDLENFFHPVSHAITVPQ